MLYKELDRLRKGFPNKPGYGLEAATPPQDRSPVYFLMCGAALH